MYNPFCYVVGGYLSGSILFARIFGELLCHRDITEGSRDFNPGAANAFSQGGFLCGVLSLSGDLLKGFLPVWLYMINRENPGSFVLAFVLAAPVLGHLYPVFFRFRGGKGIAVSFGCLLGLLPELYPVVCLAALFLFFSLVVRVTPHYYRTLVTYGLLPVAAAFCVGDVYVVLGMLLISLLILGKLMGSQEEKEKCNVRLMAAWRH